MSDIILASKSPRRISLLAGIGIKAVAIAADIDESLVDGGNPKETTRLLAKLKAKNVASAHAKDGDIVIAADTLVDLNGKPLGKPKDKADAERMLSMLSGNSHFVHTGVCIIKKGLTEISFAETSEVEFISISGEDIERYIATGEPMDKAGAYGIQEKGGLFVKGIKGDYFNIMGLPICRIGLEMKKSFGISLLDLI